MKTAPVRLNSSQIVILQTLSKCGKPLSRNELEEKTAMSIGPANLGAITDPSVSPQSLYSLGFVRPQKHEGESVTWSLTALGKKCVGSYQTRKRSIGDVVPPLILDPIFIKFRPTRSYSMELYTDSDIEAIRSLLPKAYASVPLDDIRQLMVKRRKIGAYKDPSKTTKTAVDRCLRDFGPRGTVLKGLLTEIQITALRSLVVEDDQDDEESDESK